MAAALLLRALARGVPPAALRRLGRWGFVRRAILPRLTRLLAGTEVTIPRGYGKGLRIDPGRSTPGYGLGASEPLVQEALARYLRPGSVFYDVGANVGFFTLIGARLVGEEGTVVAFEPHPETAAILQRNVKRNRAANVQVLRRAAGASSGTAKLAGEDPATARLADAGIPVRLTPVDDLIGHVRPPTLVKIDVEGKEPDVLRGMTRTLERFSPVVVCEIHGDGRAACEEILVSAGYTVRDLEREPGGMPHLLALPAQLPEPESATCVPSKATLR